MSTGDNPGDEQRGLDSGRQEDQNIAIHPVSFRVIRHTSPTFNSISVA